MWPTPRLPGSANYLLFISNWSAMRRSWAFLCSLKAVAWTSPVEGRPKTAKFRRFACSLGMRSELDNSKWANNFHFIIGRYNYPSRIPCNLSPSYTIRALFVPPRTYRVLRKRELRVQSQQRCHVLLHILWLFLSLKWMWQDSDWSLQQTIFFFFLFSAVD